MPKFELLNMQISDMALSWMPNIFEQIQLEVIR